MTIRVLAFGVGKEIIGGSSVSIELPENANVDTLKSVLEQQYPQLTQLTSLLIAVNKDYVSSDCIIKNGDEVAIIPPVSGG